MKFRDNPYILLAIAALFWSGNHIVGRAIHGVVPPIGISAVRWALPSIALFFLARAQIKRSIMRPIKPGFSAKLRYGCARRLAARGAAAIEAQAATVAARARPWTGRESIR